MSCHGGYRASDGWHLWQDNAGAPQICAQNYLEALAEGDISGHTAFQKYGRCTVSNSGIDVWEGNSVYAFPAAATKMDIVSTDNVNDKAGGTGALKVKINGLIAGYIETTEEVTLNGTTIVTTSNAFLRINKMWVSAAGSGGAAVGIITAKVTGGATVYAQISATYTQSRQAIYTVPAGKYLYIKSLSISSGVGNTTASGKFNFVIFTLRTKHDPLTRELSTIFYPDFEEGIVNGTFYRPFAIPLKLPPMTDVKMSVIGDTNLAVIATAAIRGWIE